MLKLINSLTSKFMKIVRMTPENNQQVLAEIFSPPETVRGMKTLDKSLFSKTIYLPALVINQKRYGKVMKIKDIKSMIVKKYSFYDKTPFVHKDEQTGTETVCKLMVLKPGSDLKHKEIKDLICDETVLNVFEKKKFELKYDNFDHRTVLRQILHETNDSVRGYTKVGHIVHLNLREEFYGYKNIIGEVLLDKIPGSRTIINKPLLINEEYRQINIERLAGDDDYVAEVSENGCRYNVDYSKVFWNPRLSHEHERIVNLVDKNDVVHDMFAGIGPFAIPLAKKGCEVYASDLNPDSVNFCKENAKLNKVKKIDISRQDAKLAIKEKLPLILMDKTKKKSSSNVHVLMNLPKDAVEFIDGFVHCISSKTVQNELGSEVSLKDIKPIIVHCYCFAHIDMKQDYFEKLIEEKLKIGGLSPEEINVIFSGNWLNLHRVRSVAPNKDMFCCQFQLDYRTLLQPSDEPACKKAKLEEEKARN